MEEKLVKKILSIVVSSMLIGFLACASTQEVTKTNADNRPCIKNLNREGGFLIGQKCSTYQQFEHANEGIAFDNLVFVIAAEGYQIIDASKELGMMNAAKQGSYGGGKTAHLNAILIQNNGGLLRVELTLSLPAGYVAGNMEVENLFCKILESVQIEKKNIEPNKPEQTNGDEGKVKATLIPNEDHPSEWKVGKILVVTKKASIRSEANAKSKIIKNLKKGTKVEYVGRSGDWVNIKLSTGGTGWLSNRLVAVFKPPNIVSSQATNNDFHAFFTKFRSAVKSQNKIALEKLMSSQFDWAAEGYVSREEAMQYIDQIVGWKNFWLSAKKAVSTKPKKCETSSSSNYHSGYCVYAKSPYEMELVFERGSDGNWYWTAFPGVS
jgi:hypothetical protein